MTEVREPCEHNNLKACEPVFEATKITATFEIDQHPASNICGMFTFKYYTCVDCGCIILVQNAIVEDNRKGDK